MQELIAISGIVGTLALGAISPGPSFVLVARISVATSRVNGLAASLGIGVGGALLALAALLGLQAALLAIPALYVGLKILGGLYLCYLGYRIFRGAKHALDADVADSNHAEPLSRSFWSALSTHLSNPKAAIVYASVFAAFLPAVPSLVFSSVLLVAVFAIEAGWYAIVALILSSSQPRRIFLSYKSFIDCTAGAIMVALGVKLIASAHKS